MPDIITIRSATSDDTVALLPLLADLGYPQDPTAFQKRLQLYLSAPDLGVYVALFEEKVAGFVAYSRRPLFVHQTWKLSIEGLQVLPQFQQQGIGRQLMLYIEQIAAKNDCTIIELTSGKRRRSTGTHTFYKKLGYKNEGTYAKLYLRKEIGK